MIDHDPTGYYDEVGDPLAGTDASGLDPEFQIDYPIDRSPDVMPDEISGTSDALELNEEQ